MSTVNEEDSPTASLGNSSDEDALPYPLFVEEMDYHPPEEQILDNCEWHDAELEQVSCIYVGNPHGNTFLVDEDMAMSPLYWFKMFWTEEMSSPVVLQTNLYYYQWCERNQSLFSCDWKQFTSAELFCFFTALIVLGLNKSPPPS